MNNKKLMKEIVYWVVGVVLVIAIAVGMRFVYENGRPKPEGKTQKETAAAGADNGGITDNGSIEYVGKDVSVNVTDKDGNVSEYLVETHADYLKDVMDETEGLTYETKDGMVMVVNGQRADYVLDGAYWAFYVNGAYCNYGIADQPVNDGDVFEIRYTKA